MEELLNTALNAAEAEGAEYTEVRWGEYRIRNLSARGELMQTILNKSESGLSVRTFVDGAWGFACGSRETRDDAAGIAVAAVEIARTSAKLKRKPVSLTPLEPATITWSAPMEIDPFDVPLNEKIDLLFEVNRRMMKGKMIREAISWMFFKKARKIYKNSIGSHIDQSLIWSLADYVARAVGDGRFASRSLQSSPRGAGYEYIKSIPFLDDAARVADEAHQKLTAKTPSMENADLILLPSHTRLVIHETIGHATELDRVLGWEADYAGTSFATPEKLNSYRYGSHMFNVTADRTRPGGLATCAYDDEGVKTGSWPLIRDGILTDYATTRDTAGIIGRERSHGCAFSDNWSSTPILRMANVCIEPGPADGPTLEELIADTKEGIIVDGMGTFSIDHQRINFHFGGDLCRRIHKGHIAEVLYNVSYEGSNPEFWNSVDAVCRPDEWKQEGIIGCAKGQPVQIAALTHGSAPLRIRNAGIRSH